SNVKIVNNAISTNGGIGLAMFMDNGDNDHFRAYVEGNDFHGNAVGVSITGDGAGVGAIDLGGGSFLGLQSSRGGNEFRSLIAQGTVTAAAIALFDTSPTAVIPAADNIFHPGVSPAFVVDDGVEGSLTGTGQINAAAKLDDAHAYVQSLYNQVLGRTGSLSELDPWATLFNNQGRSAVANGILHSGEGFGRIVDRLYLRFLGRASDPSGRAGWVGFLQSGGTPGPGGTFLLSCPGCVSQLSSGYVQALYINRLGRTGR